MGSEAQAVQLEVRINRQGKNLTVGAVYDRPRPSEFAAVSGAEREAGGHRPPLQTQPGDLPHRAGLR